MNSEINETIGQSSYKELVEAIGKALSEGRDKAIQTVNATLIKTNWQIGHYIVEYEQKGKERAEYGAELLNRLSHDLTVAYGKGFSRSNVFQMRQFYLAFPKIQTLSGQLSWSHYLEILKAGNELEISFYTKQCEIEKWSVRELKRQMKSGLFQRLALSRNKEEVLTLSRQGQEIQNPQDIVKDPFVLEFVGIPEKQVYLEGELEDRLIANLQDFLLEMLCKPLHKSSSMKRCKRLMSSCSRSVSRKCSPCGIPRNSRIYGSRMISLGSTRPGSVREISSFTAFLSRLASRRS